MRQFFLPFFFLSFSLTLIAQQPPKGFVYLKDIDATIISELRYFSENNFIGKPIDGYYNNVIITTKPTAIALKKAQEKLALFGLSLKIFDAYRPQQAVNHFVRWAKQINDTLKKHQFYPDVAKKDLFKLGYIAAKSGHTRGSTVDLTIIDLSSGKELDMGSPYDFFGEISHPHYKNLTKKQRANRLLLRNLMLTQGFIPYENEWWHFTLKNEPYPTTYFTFPIQK
ncbi:MAG: M15 family metallopeptidase [Flavobacteriaceae bacterium]|nr:M15 family metallopeptidase [Flavobacteriaceae bacterium]